MNTNAKPINKYVAPKIVNAVRQSNTSVKKLSDMRPTSPPTDVPASNMPCANLNARITVKFSLTEIKIASNDAKINASVMTVFRGRILANSAIKIIEHAMPAVNCS